MAILTINDQTRIDAIIDGVSQRLGVSYPENSLLDFAEKAGVQVIETDLHNITASPSGAILYEEPAQKSKPTIFIQADMPDNRKIFTLAHELGHHFLHEGDKLRVDDLDYSKDDKDTLEESQANYFAASLLVPKDLFEKKLQEDLSIDRLAEFFQVSPVVIRNRIAWIAKN